MKGLVILGIAALGSIASAASSSVTSTWNSTSTDALTSTWNPSSTSSSTLSATSTLTGTSIGTSGTTSCTKTDTKTTVTKTTTKTATKSDNSTGTTTGTKTGITTGTAVSPAAGSAPSFNTTTVSAVGARRPVVIIVGAVPPYKMENATSKELLKEPEASLEDLDRPKVESEDGSKDDIEKTGIGRIAEEETKRNTTSTTLITPKTHAAPVVLVNTTGEATGAATNGTGDIAAHIPDSQKSFLANQTISTAAANGEPIAEAEADTLLAGLKETPYEIRDGFFVAEAAQLPKTLQELYAHVAVRLVQDLTSGHVVHYFEMCAPEDQGRVVVKYRDEIVYGAVTGVAVLSSAPGQATEDAAAFVPVAGPGSASPEVSDAVASGSFEMLCVNGESHLTIKFSASVMVESKPADQKLFEQHGGVVLKCGDAEHCTQAKCQGDECKSNLVISAEPAPAKSGHSAPTSVVRAFSLCKAGEQCQCMRTCVEGRCVTMNPAPGKALPAVRNADAKTLTPDTAVPAPAAQDDEHSTPARPGAGNPVASSAPASSSAPAGKVVSIANDDAAAVIYVSKQTVGETSQPGPSQAGSAAVGYSSGFSPDSGAALPMTSQAQSSASGSPGQSNGAGPAVRPTVVTGASARATGFFNVLGGVLVMMLLL